MRLVANIYGSASAAPGRSLAFLTASSSGQLLSVVIPRQIACTFITLKTVEPQRHGKATGLRNSINAGIAALQADPACPTHLLEQLEQATLALLASDSVLAPRADGLSVAQLNIAKNILASHLEKAINISDVAIACGISRGHLNRGFRKMVGTTPMRWRMDVRLDFCRRLLMESQLPVAAIASAAGFSDPCYFSRAFARASGVSPRNWRRFFTIALSELPWKQSHNDPHACIPWNRLTEGLAMQSIEKSQVARQPHDTVCRLEALGEEHQQSRLLDWLAGWLAQCITLGQHAHSASRHLIRAIEICVSQSDPGGLAAAPSANALAAWQEQLAKAMLMSGGDSPLSINAVARACGMSYRHFSRAFKATVGPSPQRWRLMYRIEKAKVLMLESEFSLTDIAYECGFAEQSHFNHTFYKLAGESPRAWRRRQFQVRENSRSPDGRAYDDFSTHQSDTCSISR